MRQRIVNSVFSVLVLCSSSVLAAQKVVFVVGNSQYQAAKLLSNPVNDAIDIEAKFKQLGDTTIIIQNATRKEMIAGLQRFRKELQGSEVGVFYYAGHGVELDRYNYLVPVDAAMNDPMEVKYETLALDDVAKVLNESGVKSGFIVLDACRDNPFKAASRSGSRGLQHMSKDTVGELKIIYAAQEGQVANDGNDRNGVFTSQFLRYLGEPNLSYPFFFDKVKQGVVQKSGGKQRPTEQGEISPSFSFVPAGVEAVKPAPVVNPVADAEITFWNSIANSTDANDYAEYLKAYPNGKFAGLAQSRKDKYTVKPQQLAQVQVRDKPTPASLTNSDEQLMKKGTWRDPKTNLVWMRCSLGQTWNGKTCTGEAKKYTWQEALDAAKAFNSNGGVGGYTDWVIPHIEDLPTIRYCSTGFDNTREIPTKAGDTKTIEDGCKGEGYQRPTINQTIFPNTKDSVYWSSSPLANDGAYAWSVYFYDGSGGYGGKGYARFVRLVRTSQ